MFGAQERLVHSYCGMALAYAAAMGSPWVACMSLQAFCLVFLPFPFVASALLFSLPCSRDSDPGSHSRLTSPLIPTAARAFFYREKTLALSFMVDSRWWQIVAYG